MNYNPFVSLQWMLDGKTVGGMPMRGPEETPTREEALRIYTLGSAWFSFDDGKRGSLTPGKLADLAVLTKDYLSVPVEEIGSIASLLTMVGGRVVYATGPSRGAGGEGRGLSVASHSITSSAVARTPDGIVKPSALAVLRLRIELEFGRQLQHRHVGRLLALENPPGVDAGLAKSVGNGWAVAHQAAGRARFALHVHRWNRMPGGERDDVLPMSE